MIFSDPIVSLMAGTLVITGMVKILRRETDGLLYGGLGYLIVFVGEVSGQ